MTNAEIEVMDVAKEMEVFEPVTAAVEDAKVRCANIVLSYDTPDEIKEAKSFIYQIRKLKAPVAEIHKLAKAEAKKFTDALDGKKRELMGAIQEMIDEKEAPIKDLEEKETQRLAAEALKKQRAEEAAEAERQAKIDEQKRLLMEKEAELLERQNELDRKEREKAIAEAAARKAEEKANQARIDADIRHKQSLIDAENRRVAEVQREKDRAAAEAAEKERQAKEAEAARINELQRQQEAHEAAVQRQKEVDDRRIADEAHRSTIHRAIYTAMVELPILLDKGQCQILTQALIDKKLPHVHIQY